MPEAAIDTVYLVHHSHTDIGYTHDQPVVWDLYRRFLEQAVDLCARDADRDGDDCFHWTVETTAPLIHWLETAPPARRRLLADLCRLGRIEVTAMPMNLTPLCDTAELAEALEESLTVVRQELGVTVRYAMNSDVSGHNWPLADVLLDAGVAGFSMSMAGIPEAFLWEGPSGRRIPTWKGWPYALGWADGIGHDVELFATRWPEKSAHVSEVNRFLTAIMLQVTINRYDNAPPVAGLPGFVRQWNASATLPHLVMATPTAWWSRVNSSLGEWPVRRGDWTDSWNFGAGSSAFETAMNRNTRSRLEIASRAQACLPVGPTPEQAYRQAPARVRSRATLALQLWDEHTWGANISVSHPFDEDTISQWYHKAHAAYDARSLSLMLRRDAVAELARRLRRDTGDALLVFNPLPQSREVTGPVPDLWSGIDPGDASDPTSARHLLDRYGGDRYGSVERTAEPGWGYLPPTVVPGFGYSAVPVRALLVGAEIKVSNEQTVENGRCRITFDTEKGGIRSWYDLHMERELVDPTAPWPLHAFVHECPAEGDPARRSVVWSRGKDWMADRRGPRAVIEHRVERTPLGVRIVQRFDAPGVRDLTQVTTLGNASADLVLESRWCMTDERDAEATYLVFPFAVTDPQVRYDVGGHAVRPEVDQLPGACRDYFSVQRWVDVEGGGGGIGIACPDTPLWQFSDFSFAANRRRFVLEHPWLMAWVTNNYWHTNFRASQPGPVRARFVLRPYAGSFDESAAHRLGGEVAMPVVFHHLGEPPVQGAELPASGSFLQMPQPPIQVLSVRPDLLDGSVLIRVLNASNASAEARLAPSLLAIQRAASADGLGTVHEVLPVQGDGSVALRIGARRLATLKLWLR